MILGRILARFVIAMMLCAAAAGVAVAQTPQNEASKHCRVDGLRPADRVFAKVSDRKPWQEYKKIEDIPELDNGFGSSAEVWQGRQNSQLVRVVEPGEDFYAYTQYCFDSGGQLAYLSYELRTAWGWGFRRGGSVVKGSVEERSAAFFSTETEKPISRPEGADDVPNALKPTLYLETTRLPFFDLLSRHASK